MAKEKPASGEEEKPETGYMSSFYAIT